MKNYIYPAIFSKDGDGIGVEFPDLKGCLTCADTFEEALAMAKEAMAGWILSNEDRNIEIPAPSMTNAITKDEGDIVALVEFNSFEYRKQHNKKSVKKTLSIPEWLNTLAEDANVNFSNVLQQGLKQKLGI